MMPSPCGLTACFGMYPVMSHEKSLSIAHLLSVSFSINIGNALCIELFVSSIIFVCPSYHSTAKAWLSGTALEVQFFKLNKLEIHQSIIPSVPSVIFFKYSISIKYKAPKIFSTFSCFYLLQLLIAVVLDICKCSPPLQRLCGLGNIPIHKRFVFRYHLPVH